MRIHGSLIAAVAALLFCGTAQAQDTGFYAGGDVGFHWPDRIDTHVAGTSEDWAWRSDNNAEGFLRLGYGLGSGFRLELEGGYRPSGLNDIQADIFLPLASAPLIPAGGIHFTGVSGHVDATTLMANAYYDIPFDLPVQPFIGAGAGLVHTSVSARGGFPFCAICARPPICFPVCSINLKVDDSSDRLGWQLMGGLSWPIAPQWTVDATYRYMRANGVTWQTQAAAGLFTPGKFRGDYSDSSVTIGVRYSFDGGP